MPILSILLFTLINLLNYLDRYLVPAVLPLIMTQYSLNNAQAGRLVSAFVYGYFICSPIFGYLGDRYSRPKLMAIGVILWSVATLTSAYAASFMILFMARIAVGVGEASFGTITPGYIKDRIRDPLKVNRVFSIFFAAIPAGSALAYVVSGYVVRSFSWSGVFVLGGVPGIILALFLLGCPEVRARQLQASVPLWEGLRSIARIPVLWFAIGGYVLNSFALNGVAAFVTKYGVSVGFELNQISRYFGLILVVTGFCGTIGGGWLAEQWSKHKANQASAMLKFVGLSALAGVPFVFLAFGLSNHHLFLGSCFAAQLFIFAGVAPVNAVIVSVCPPRLVTLTQGVAIFALNLFGALPAPQLVGKVADLVSLSAGLQLCGVTLLMSALIWLVGSSNKWRASQENDVVSTA